MTHKQKQDDGEILRVTPNLVFSEVIRHGGQHLLINQGQHNGAYAAFPLTHWPCHTDV